MFIPAAATARAKRDYAALGWRYKTALAEVTKAPLCRIIDITGSGDASDRARFRNYAAPRTLMTNAIAVAKTIIANRLIGSDASQAPS